MHNGNPVTSDRLARTLRFLRACKQFGATTAEIQSFTASMAPGTDISELRHAGHDIECKYQGTMKGRRIFRYTYRGKKEQ